MKKIALLLALILIVMSMASCAYIEDLINPDIGDDNTPPSGDNTTDDPQDKPDDDPVNPNQPDKPDEPNQPDTPENPNNPDNNENNPIVPPTDNINPEMIKVNGLKGLNEQIWLGIDVTDNFEYKVSYKADDAEEYTELDSELMIASDGKLDCYILGVKAGNYKIKIEAENDSQRAAKVYEDISVEAQDRSGYAHFGYDEGIGAYNNDGTVKEGTVIIYVTNENKNTITMTIKGTEYVGLVNIMEKLFQCDTPVLIRVIGTITTNQWNYKNVEPRLVDGSNDNPSFFENTFSNEYGENLANLKRSMAAIGYEIVTDRGDYKK